MKLSLLAFYWRIFNIASIRWPIRILIVAVIAWLFARVRPPREDLVRAKLTVSELAVHSHYFPLYSSGSLLG